VKGAVGLDADVRLLDRHVLTETAVAGGAATGAFVFVMVAGNLLNQVSSAIASGRVSGWEGLELIALLIPGVLPYALPLGLLTGVLLAFGRMGSQQELTAMKAGGLSLGRIARPALLLAAALALLSAWLNLEVAPAANTEYRRLLVGSAKDNPASVIVPGQLNRQFPGMVIRASARDGEVLRDFWLWRVDDRGRLVQTVHAREAKIQLMAHLASAFSVFSLAFLAVPLAVRVGRAETFVNAAIALAIALTYYLLTSMAGYVKDPAYRPDLLVWLPNLVVITLGWFLLRRASRH
jgi:lipopolysaccharide export LptBFGC system permease protein LptF